MTEEYFHVFHKIITLLVVIPGLFFLFAIAVEFYETSILFLILAGFFILYIAFLLPKLDYRINKSPIQYPEPGHEGLKSRQYRDIITFLAITVLTFVVMHLCVLLMHEFSHSFFAYAIGQKQDPFNIIYGNWIGAHWDENVDYSRLFSAGLGPTAAAIAFAGPLSNIVLFFVTAGFLFSKTVKKHRWIYHCIFWTLIITFVMIFEYVFTRSFIPHDDFGNINHGLLITPWPIFIVGTCLGLLGLYYILGKKIPEYYAIVTPHNRSNQYLTIGAVSFVIFLFYIGVSLLSYPEIPRWWCGLAGIVALFIVPFLASPSRRWVQIAIKKQSPDNQTKPD